MKKSTRPSTVIPSSRWAAYASAGLATAFGSAGAVQAEIHYSGPVKEIFDAGTHSTIEGSFAVEGGEKLVFDFGRFGAGRGSALFQIEGVFGDSLPESFRGSQPGGSGFAKYPAKLRTGDLISDGNFVVGSGGFGLLASSHERPGTQWKGRDRGFIGFRFDLGSGFQYGWVRVRKMADNSFVVVDYAWGDPGDAVTAGEERTPALPEKGSLGWLALGAAGLTAWRQARRAGAQGPA
jgi:hypothetical protein